MIGEIINRHSSAPLRFLVVGAANNALTYAVYLALLVIAGLHPVVAMTLSYSFGIVMSYTLNKLWTFGHSGGRDSILRFVVLYWGVYVANCILLSLAVYLSLDPAISQIFIVVFLACITYCVQKLWVFKPEHELASQQ